MPGMSDRKRWLVAFGLAALAPAVTAGFFALADQVDPSYVDGGSNVRALWFAWIGISVAAAVGAGIVGRQMRGPAASAIVWGVLIAAAYVLSDPSCPLQMSDGGGVAPPRGAAVLGVVDGDGVACGAEELTRWSTAGWVVLAGFVATLITTAGAIIGGLARWLWGRSRPGTA